MPLHILPTSQTPADLHSTLRASSKATMLIFYSSPGANGKMWCPYCVQIAPLVNKVFGAGEEEEGGGADAPEATVIYVGDRSTWKTPTNPWRAPPFSITGVPTIVKYENDKFEELEYDEDIPSEARLREFIKS